ncbi:carboxyl-terminal processing protease [Clostridiales Family XIII bacterium PM5-7]
MIKMRKGKFATLIICTVLATLLAVAGLVIVLSKTNSIVLVNQSDYDTMTEITEKYGKLYSMQNTINEKTLWELNPEKQMEGIYNGLLDSLEDNYSNYMNAEEYEALKKSVSGTFTGIGVFFTIDEQERALVTGVISGSPADLAGLKEGDIITKVNGKAYTDVDKITAAIRGEEGTKVSLTYKRGSKTKTADMVRAVVEDISVRSAVLKGNIGYISIKAFERGTADQFKTELASLENKNVNGLIIDLRNNGGGVFEESIEVADMLLPECTITFTKDREGKKKTFNSDGECTKLKYVLLVNENTASASEVITAAVKDNQGGKIVGMNTYGKGIIQGIIEFGDDTAMRLTISQYFSPKGDKIQEKGIAPDYKVGIKVNGDKQLEKAMSLFK